MCDSPTERSRDVDLRHGHVGVALSFRSNLLNRFFFTVKGTAPEGQSHFLLDKQDGSMSWVVLRGVS